MIRPIIERKKGMRKSEEREKKRWEKRRKGRRERFPAKELAGVGKALSHSVDS